MTEHVREKFSCRSCEKITQPPAPFHAIARGFAGPSLLAMMLVGKYANHQPLNRQSEQFAREGIELSVGVRRYMGCGTILQLRVNATITSLEDAKKYLEDLGLPVPVIESDYEEIDASDPDQAKERA